MVDVITVLVGVSLILFFCYFAEFLFKKIHVPDLLFLILLGVAIGPWGFKIIAPADVANFAPVFTTFALMFLIFDGAFNIDLASFAKGLSKSLILTIFNFFVSTIVVTVILYLLIGMPFLIALLVGVILGGVSSAFVIPLLNQLPNKGKFTSVLTLESAMTDVFVIVFALTVIEIIQLNVFSAQAVFTNIASLFAIAGFIGIIAGIIWIVLAVHLFKDNQLYMITIAYLIIVYVVTELLNGNGAIAALFLGLVLKNSKQLTGLFNVIVNKRVKNEKDDEAQTMHAPGIAVTSRGEELFYDQISFFLKVLFFVYVGMLLDFSNKSTLLIGMVLSVAIMFSRQLSSLVMREYSVQEKKLCNAIFARGLAAAAIVQIVALSNIASAELLQGIVYAVISFTIILSSVKVFLIKRTAAKTAS